MTLAGIVLAGGASSRFGRDKLAVEVGGRRLLDLAVEAVGGMTALVIVALAREDDRSIEAPAGTRLVRVHDSIAGGGPLIGLVGALDAAALLGADAALVVGGDMPRLQRGVLEALVDRLADPAVDAVAPIVRGRRRPLPSAVRVGPAAEAARLGIAAGDGRLRGVLERLQTVELDEIAWREWDPEGDTFLDIDVGSDLPPGASAG